MKMIGFGGLEEVRFRDPVIPGDRLVISRLLKAREAHMNHLPVPGGSVSGDVVDSISREFRFLSTCCRRVSEHQ